MGVALLGGESCGWLSGGGVWLWVCWCWVWVLGDGGREEGEGEKGEREEGGGVHFDGWVVWRKGMIN